VSANLNYNVLASLLLGFRC